jgi:hypothetical protein
MENQLKKSDSEEEKQESDYTPIVIVSDFFDNVF